MSNDQLTEEELRHLIEQYCRLLDDGLQERWDKMPKDLYSNEQQEVLGALIARQVTIAKYIAQGQNLRNHHIGPILLRTMIDAYIALAWILQEPNNRSEQFIQYGLGQEKLQIEHFKALPENTRPEVQAMIKLREEWVNTQRYMSLTIVDIGSWSGLDTRKMAEEIDELELYRFAYTPFTACGHNMWQHIGKYNLKTCINPLHKYHQVPDASILNPEFDYLIKSAKYLQKTFKKVDEILKLACLTTLPLDYWNKHFAQGN